MTSSRRSPHGAVLRSWVRRIRGPGTRHHPGPSAADRAFFDEISGRLHGLLIRLDDRLPREQATLVAEFIDATELSLALEHLADVLSEDEQPLDPDERADMLALGQRMRMGDRVPRALQHCPGR